MRRIIPVAAVAFAVVSTGVAVAFAASMPAPQQQSTPTPAGLVPQTYATTTTPGTGSRSTVSPAPGRSRVGVAQQNVAPAVPAEATTTTVLPVACAYPPAAPEPLDPLHPSAPRRTPAPTPTVTAVFPPDTCPPYVAYP